MQKLSRVVEWGFTVPQRFDGYVVLLALIALPFGAARSQPAAPDTMAARVLACASCHGAEGEGTSDVYFPRLAGKPAGYLYNQLVAFKDGRRRYPPMNYLLEFLPDAYLKEIADYFASLRPPFPRLQSPSSARKSWRAANRWSSGDPQRGIPACASCHGPTFTGMEPAIPGLLGLRANYISAQLGAWRYGTRTAAAPDCMQIVAGRLTEDDVKAVAAWLSSRPGAARPRLRAARQPSDAVRLRQRTELRGMSCTMPPILKRCTGCLLWSVPVVGAPAAAGAAGGAAGQRGHPRGRVSGARRRLHRLPHRAGGQDSSPAARHEDAVRHALHLEHHARSGNRHRQMDRRPVLFR